MSLPPTIVRELRVTARRPATYWIRAGIAGLAILACIYWFDVKSIAFNPAGVGRVVFNMLSLLGVTLAAGACILTADSISSERRQGTLGLLFLTSLNSRQVVFGKLAVFGFATLYAILGLAPALMLSLCAGGVTWGEVARMMILLLNVLLLSLAAGLLASSLSWSQSAAVVKSLALLLLVVVTPYGLEWAMKRAVSLQLSHASVVSGYQTINSPAYVASPARYWISMTTTHAAAWGLLGAAALSLKRNWRRVHLPRALKPGAFRNRRLLGALRAVIIGRLGQRRTFAPVARALLRQRGQRALAWSAAIVCFVGSLGMAAATAAFGSLLVAGSVGLIFNLAGLTMFAMVAGRFFMDARQTGELELLLVTPVGARGVLKEQRMALNRLILGPVYLVVFGAFIAAVTGFHLSPNQPFQTLLYALGHIAGVVLNVLAVVRVATLFSAHCRSYFALLGATIGLVVLAPAVIVNLMAFLLSSPSPLAPFAAGIRSLLFLAASIGFILWAGAGLRREFRSQDCSRIDRFFGWCGR